MKYQIKTPEGNRLYFKLVISMLLAAGYKYHDVDNIDVIVERYSSFPWIVFRTDTKYVGGNSAGDERYKTVNLVKLVKILSSDKRSIEVVLNDKYIAKVFDDCIVVGCTTFEISKLHELMNAWRKIHDSASG